MLYFTVFQQKTARGQSDGDKFHGPKKPGTDISVYWNNLEELEKSYEY